MTKDQSAYEARQLAELQSWLAKPPSLIARGFGRTTSPLVRVMKPWAPTEMLERSFDLANKAGGKLAWRNQVIKSFDVASLEELRAKPLQECDEQWASQRRRMMLLAGGEGALTGLGGAVGWTLDVPALLVLALQGVHLTATCYGEEWADQSIPLAVFSLAAANSMKEKQAAWQSALMSEISAPELLEGLERTLNQSFAKRAATMSMAKVGGQLGLNLGRRKALGMVPLAGAVVGGSVNAWYLRDVMNASRYVCHALRFAN